MMKILFRMTFAIALVLVMTATGLWAAGASDSDDTAAAADKETVFDPATGRTWTAPQYGGTLTWAANAYPQNADAYWVGGWAPHFISGVLESPAYANWAISRDTWDGTQNEGPEVARGALAESWSMPDDTTFIWHIRQGVYWDDKAPVNGRELDAYDVEWNYHRMLGLGDFTEAGPLADLWIVALSLPIESVPATDKWTVEIKLTKPQLNVDGKMLRNMFFVYAPEQIEKYGDAKDWRNLVGTGPLRMTDHVEGSSVTWEKNPNYWGYDEKFPENRLPYIDEYRSLLMPDMSTRVAALRTGKIDMLSNVGDAYITSLDDLESLQRTNPEIEVWPGQRGTGAYIFNYNLPPTSDVNVRKALQMSVDRETIAATYFKGYGDPTPYGLMIQSAGGWSWPMEEWPDEVKHEYEYHPEDAEALLDEAGYPRGADGYRLKVKIGHDNRADPTYGEIIMGYFEAIGVESELTILSSPEGAAAQAADEIEYGLIFSSYGAPSGFVWTFMTIITQNFDGFSHNKAKDPRIDALYVAARDTTDSEEYRSLYRQADEITVREHWGLVKSSSARFSVTHPWVQGYFGEEALGLGERNAHLARIGIDS